MLPGRSTFHELERGDPPIVRSVAIDLGNLGVDNWRTPVQGAARGRTGPQVGLGSVHGLASPSGAFFPIPHGVVCGTLVAAATRTNIQALREREPGSPALQKYAEAGILLSGRMFNSESAAQDGLVALLDAWNRARDETLEALEVTVLPNPDAVLGEEEPAEETAVEDKLTEAKQAVEDARKRVDQAKAIRPDDWWNGVGSGQLKPGYQERVRQAEQELKAAERALRPARRGQK